MKEIETDFSSSKSFREHYDKLHQRLVSENPAWKPLLFGGNGKYPDWFYKEFLRVFRPPISRTLKKANRQLRETKKHFGIDNGRGILLQVNDKFTTFGAMHVFGLASKLLVHSYSSIDCLVYLTVNSYVEVQNSPLAHLIWTTSYKDDCDEAFVSFVDNLGRQWHNYIEAIIGTYDTRIETPSRAILSGAKTIKVRNP